MGGNIYRYMRAKLLSLVQLSGTPWTPWLPPCSPPVSAVHGTLQARILEPVAIDLPNPQMETASLASPALAGGFFTTSAAWEVSIYVLMLLSRFSRVRLCATP